MRQRLVAQQAKCVIDQESCCVEHHQHFGSDRFGEGLSRFSRDRFGDRGFSFVQVDLEVAQDLDSLSNPDLSPCGLRNPRPGYCGVNVTIAQAFEFSENFARGGIDRRDLCYARCDLEFSGQRSQYSTSTR